MNAIELLESQHRQVEDLFAEYYQLEEGDEEGKHRAFLQLADLLSAHASVEEQRFYPAVKRAETAVQLEESVREHHAARRRIAELLDMDAGDPEFDTRMERLQEEVDHHVREEEGRLFAQVRRFMGTEELDGLGRELQGDFDTLMREGPHRKVLEELEGPTVVI